MSRIVVIPCPVPSRASAEILKMAVQDAVARAVFLRVVLYKGLQ